MQRGDVRTSPTDVSQRCAPAKVGRAKDVVAGFADRAVVAFVAVVLTACVGCGERNTKHSAASSVAHAGASQQSAKVLPRSEFLQRDGKHDREIATRFELKQPEETGIAFVHEWNPPPDQVDRLNSYAIGAGVAMGDVDGDALPDVFLACPTNGGRLFRNLGGFRFEDVTAQCGMSGGLAGMWATGCTFADIDGDGDLDLYVCGYNTRNRLFINNGQGRFDERAADYGLDFLGASVMLAFADYDGDGDLDAYLLTNHLRPDPREKFQVELRGGRPTIPERFRQFRDILIPPAGHGAPKLIEAAQYDVLFRNDGGTTFADVTVSSGIGRHNHHGLSATWWDCNSDGLPDLYVANDFFGPDHLYVNNGDGTFTDRAQEFLPHMPWFSMGSDSADINNDGLFDFIATDMSSSSPARAHVTMADLAADSWFLDFAEPRQYMRNALYLNSGADRFMEVAYQAGVASTDWTWTAKFADLDGDGWIDLFVTNGMTRDFQNSDLKNASRKAAGSSPSPLEFWQRQEPLRERNLVFHNKSDCQFEEVGSAWGLDHLGISLGAAFADLDGDGDLDIVVNNFGEQASVYQNHTTDQHYVRIRLQDHGANRFGIDSVVRIKAGGQLQARYLTLSRGFMSSDELVVHFGIGQATQLDWLEVRWRDGTVQRFVDLPGDRIYTVAKIATADSDSIDERPMAGSTLFARMPVETPMLHREREFDDFSRQPLLPSRQSQRGPGMAYGDANGDGWGDLYLCGAAGQMGQLYLGNPLGFQQSPLFDDSLSIVDWPSATAEEMGAVFFDFDGDGDLDLYIVTGGVESEPGEPDLRDRLLVNRGDGRFLPASKEILPTVAESGSCVCAADFDRDGDLDLFVGGGSVPGEYPVASKSYLLVNSAGALTDQTSDAAPAISQLGLVTSALWSDVDNDGWIDLLVTQEWGAVALFKNEMGKLIDRTNASGIADRRGWWNGISGRDVDHDGDIDYVVANYGTNTRYRASEKSPAVLLYGDFDGSGERHIVEATMRDAELYPVRGKTASEMAVPMLELKFPRYSDFASATLSEIYGPQSIADALRLEANTLESGVLLNNGQGRFDFVALPRLAQIAPSFGVQMTDFNADGHCDVVLAQNFFSPQRESGRMNGGLGLLLLGNGDGTFQPLWPNKSGIVVAEDAKSLLVADIDHDDWADFIVGINDGEVQIYKNLRVGVGQTAVVRLVGSPGNATAIGARVELQTQDGSSQVAEVTAGGSYLSQSTSTLFFGVRADQRITKVHVRWPNGRKTACTPKANSNITIDYALTESSE